VSAKALSIACTGLVTGVGLDAPSTCAAIRGAIDNFQETRFRDRHGEWLMGCEVPFTEPIRGERRLLKMAASAISECLDATDRARCEATPLLLCLAETKRAGRIVRDDSRFFSALQDELGCRFHAQSAVISSGHVSAAVALRHARHLLAAGGVTQVLVAACDSLLVGAALADCEQRDRLLTSRNSDGFIPGEGAAALLVETLRWQPEGQLACHGVGFAVEKAHIDSEEPLRADGLTTAIKQSLDEAGYGESVLQFKIIDASGGQYVFKEAALAFGRIDRTKRTEFDVWHPADCIGEVGAAIGLVMIAVLKAACEKGYAKGTNVLLHLGNDDGHRASMIFSWHSVGS
jgi:3-oxoacyl-[acyl-carrier-protein] synthase-1